MRHIRLATARPGQDMVDLKAADLESCRELTVFTAVASTPDDRIPERVEWHAHASGNTPGSASAF